MQYFIMLAALFALNSCNTMIGLGRDTKQGYQWTKEKIQNSGNNNHSGGSTNRSNPSSSPVY